MERILNQRMCSVKIQITDTCSVWCSTPFLSGGKVKLRDDLQGLDNEDEEADAEAAARAKSKQRRRVRFQKSSTKKKKKEVPMVWNRALRAYVPVNNDGSDAAWMSY